MRNRGPDAQGSWSGRLGGQCLSLLHTRLAIIDLDPLSNQPFERNGKILSYNGELYNYLELRKTLESLGQRFRTSSDTEVVMAAIETWGHGAFDRMEGMWALAWADPANDQLLLSRDRFGEKPLYTWQRGDTFYFASEIKTLAALAGEWPKVNVDTIKRFLVTGYKTLYKAPGGWFEDVHEFPAAGVGIVSSSTPMKIDAYWKPRFSAVEMSYEDALSGVKDRLARAVELRMRADVPIAFCLSGGIDSSTLAAIAAKQLDMDIHCFSVIDNDERYDERENIGHMVKALGCKHFSVETSTENFFPRLAELTRYHDAPVITVSYYMHAFLSEALAENGYKVAISGTAADEIFTGYYDHYPMWLAHMRTEVDDASFDTLVADWRDGPGRYVNNPLLQDPARFIATPEARDHITLDAALFSSYLRTPYPTAWTETRFTSSLLRNRMLNELMVEATPVILTEDDRNSMRVSVENRSPFLDRELVDFMHSVPTRHLIGGGYSKRLLRDAGEGLVPDAVRLDKRKRGFNASILSLIDTNDGESREQLLRDSPIFDIVRREAIEDFLNSDMTSNSFSKFLFSFVAAKTFMDQHA